MKSNTSEGEVKHSINITTPTKPAFTKKQQKEMRKWMKEDKQRLDSAQEITNKLYAIIIVVIIILWLLGTFS